MGFLHREIQKLQIQMLKFDPDIRIPGVPEPDERKLEFQELVSFWTQDGAAKEGQQITQ